VPTGTNASLALKEDNQAKALNQTMSGILIFHSLFLEVSNQLGTHGDNAKADANSVRF
jgi:hypothetical protein